MYVYRRTGGVSVVNRLGRLKYCSKREKVFSMIKIIPPHPSFYSFFLYFPKKKFFFLFIQGYLRVFEMLIIFFFFLFLPSPLNRIDGLRWNTMNYFQPDESFNTIVLESIWVNVYILRVRRVLKISFYRRIQDISDLRRDSLRCRIKIPELVQW